MDRVAIIGLGLMGGSLGLALKARGFAGKVSGYTRSPERRALAHKRGAVDEIFDTAADAVRGADVAVFCAPILSIPGLVQQTLTSLKPGCIVTDVGSTKEFLVNSLEPLVADAGCEFIGCHPIAGSEKQSIDAARADLYERAAVVITPTEKSSPGAIGAVSTLWKSVGGVVLKLTPADHDLLVSRTSHLPHLVAAVLAATVGREPPLERVGALCGSGFRDTTRVAAGSPDIWRDILATNHGAILEELKAYRIQLDEIIQMLKRNDFSQIATLLEQCRVLRQKLLSSTGVKEGDVT